ncbi:MAG: NAD(P)H-dependent oxidoreductase [Bacteroidota bacterium]|nr:NAD(P)H-dependent oxidoreductase [Candidatus Kapabacteria bacterium]MDW8219703.1 NAD(P)H-dependent oxidoreductase [Bacteroidota bacterium]
MTKSIVAFAGSTSSTSINRRLVLYTLREFKEYSVQILDLNNFEMPLYSADREKMIGIPAQAYAFREHMMQSDGIVCSLAEHNRSYTAAFKNVLDWCSRVDMNIYANKPMLLMSTSPGKLGGQGVLEIAKAYFPRCGAQIAATFSLPLFHQNFGENGILEQTLRTDHTAAVQRFRQSVESA